MTPPLEIPVEIRVEFGDRGGYLSFMRRFLSAMLVLAWLASVATADAATGRIIKVLPQYLDLKGRTSLAPSLYERDAYQALLLKNPKNRSGVKFFVQWKVKGVASTPLTLRIELRGIAEGDLPRQKVLEQPLTARGRFSHWAELTLSGREYKEFGEITAWRATLWEGDTQLGEQKSFLW